MAHYPKILQTFSTSGGSGTSGSGTSGTNGVDGTSGTNGAAGTSGTNGAVGTSGTSGVAGTSGTSGAGVANYYASYSSSVTQSLTGASTPTVVTYNTIEIENGISVVSGSRITVQYSGIYEFGYSPQIEKTAGGPTVDVDFFIRKNGNDIIRTDSVLGLANQSAKQLPFVSTIIDMVQGDYIELVFASTSTDIQLVAIAASTSPYIHPAAPSIIITMKNIGVATMAYTSTSGTSGTRGTSGTSAPYPSTNLFNYYNFI